LTNGIGRSEQLMACRFDPCDESTRTDGSIGFADVRNGEDGLVGEASFGHADIRNGDVWIIQPLHQPLLQHCRSLFRISAPGPN
jgi:hypothetical protein